MKYKIKKVSFCDDWKVVSGAITQLETNFQGSLADCLAWIKAKNEGLL